MYGDVPELFFLCGDLFKDVCEGGGGGGKKRRRAPAMSPRRRARVDEHAFAGCTPVFIMVCANVVVLGAS